MEKEADMSDETGRQAGDPAEPAIPFEMWAEIAAELLERTSAERLEILVRRSVKPEDWTPSDEHWAALMAEEIAEGDFTRADVYAKRCADVFKARRDAAMVKPAEAHPAQEAAAPAAAPVAAVAQVVETAPVVPVAPVVVVAPSIPIQAPAAVMAPSIPIQAPAAVTAPSIPIQAPAAGIPPVQPPAVVMAPAQPKGATPAAPPQASDPLMGTVLGVDSPWVAALPFAPKVPDQMALEGAAKHASAVQPSGPGQRAMKLGETTSMPALNELLLQTLPFAGPGGPPAAGPPEIPRPADVPPSSESAAPGKLPDFTIERFASLCAELELDSARSAEILERYRVRAEQKAMLDMAWAARFRAEPATFATFQEAKTVYTRWLLSVKGGPA
jgi:hypothetical protein